jgi:hypothetical protein
VPEADSRGAERSGYWLRAYIAFNVPTALGFPPEGVRGYGFGTSPPEPA